MPSATGRRAANNTQQATSSRNFAKYLGPGKSPQRSQRLRRSDRGLTLRRLVPCTAHATTEGCLPEQVPYLRSLEAPSTARKGAAKRNALGTTTSGSNSRQRTPDWQVRAFGVFPVAGFLYATFEYNTAVASTVVGLRPWTYERASISACNKVQAPTSKSPPARPPARCCRTHTRIHRTAPRSTRCGSQIWRAHGSPVACTCTADGGARDSLLPCMCHFGLIVARRDTQSVGIPVARSSPHQPTDGRTASMPPSKTCPRSRRPCWRDDDDDQQSRGFNLAPGAKAGRPPSKPCCQSTMADEPLSSGTDA